jgi:hypothetical protein
VAGCRPVGADGVAVPTDGLTAARLRDLDEAVAQEAAVLARPLAV